MIYEMVTGRLPFKCETDVRLALMHLYDPPPSPRALVPALDAKWESVILRCLAKSPEHRFASVTDVKTAL